MRTTNAPALGVAVVALAGMGYCHSWRSGASATGRIETERPCRGGDSTMPGDGDAPMPGM